jgi:hypothetical protein
VEVEIWNTFGTRIAKTRQRTFAGQARIDVSSFLRSQVRSVMAYPQDGIIRRDDSATVDYYIKWRTDTQAEFASDEANLRHAVNAALDEVSADYDAWVIRDANATTEAPTTAAPTTEATTEATTTEAPTTLTPDALSAGSWTPHMPTASEACAIGIYPFTLFTNTGAFAQDLTVWTDAQRTETAPGGWRYQSGDYRTWRISEEGILIEFVPCTGNPGGGPNTTGEETTTTLFYAG